MKRVATLGLAAVVFTAACSDNPMPSAPPALDVPSAAKWDAPVSAPVPGHFIVVFKNTVENVHQAANDIAARHNSSLDNVYTTAIRGAALQLTDLDVAAVRADPRVAFVEQDRMMTLQSTQTSAPWGIDRID